jgi:hypothetical protein
LDVCPPVVRQLTETTANMTMTDQLSEHDRIELLARAQDAWDRAPQNTMRAVFEWRGKKVKATLLRRRGTRFRRIFTGNRART